MSLKILLFPLCIVLSLTVIIAYIKPDVVDILAKRTSIETTKANLARVDTTITNVKRMTLAIDQRSEGEKFVMKYLPVSLEEERVLDTFNYLATQSGVVIVEADIKEDAPVEEALPEVLHASASFEELANAQVINPATPPDPQTRTLRSYTASIIVMGAYGNLKDFFQRLSQSDRFRHTILFSIEKPSQNELKNDGETPLFPSDYLRGIYEAAFVHFPIYQVKSALDLALFESEKFDFGVVDELINFVNNPLPPIEANSTNTPNPFQ